MSLSDIFSSGLDAIAAPGQYTRGVLSGRPGEKLGGRDMLESWGVLGPNKPGFDPGDIAGFLAEALVDPLNLIPVGAIGTALGLGRKGAMAAKLGARALPETAILDAAKGVPGVVPGLTSQVVHSAASRSPILQALEQLSSIGEKASVVPGMLKSTEVTDDFMRDVFRPGIDEAKARFAGLSQAADETEALKALIHSQGLSDDLVGQINLSTMDPGMADALRQDLAPIQKLLREASPGDVSVARALPAAMGIGSADLPAHLSEKARDLVSQQLAARTSNKLLREFGEGSEWLADRIKTTGGVNPRTGESWFVNPGYAEKAANAIKDRGSLYVRRDRKIPIQYGPEARDTDIASAWHPPADRVDRQIRGIDNVDFSGQLMTLTDALKNPATQRETVNRLFSVPEWATDEEAMKKALDAVRQTGAHEATHHMIGGAGTPNILPDRMRDLRQLLAGVEERSPGVIAKHRDPRFARYVQHPDELVPWGMGLKEAIGMAPGETIDTVAKLKERATGALSYQTLLNGGMDYESIQQLLNMLFGTAAVATPVAASIYGRDA